MAFRLRTIQTSFISGQLSRRMRGRVDVKHYYQGANVLQNVLIYPQGGVRRRYGTKFVADLETTDNVRLVPFEFSTTQNYLLVATAGNLAVYKEGVFQTNITVPYGDVDMEQLNWTQSADTLILVHPQYPPRRVLRVSDTNWTTSEIDIKFIPKFAYNPTVENPSADITPNDTGGTVKITASSSVFTSDDVGGVITGNGGELRISEYLSGTVVIGEAVIPFVDDTTISDGDWSIERGYEDVWSSSRGWPQSAVFHNNRLWFGGSFSRPQTLWGSRIADYFNFDKGTGLADEAIEITADTDDVNSIRYMVSGDNLILLTSGSEFYLDTDSDPQIIRRQDRRGIPFVRPVYVDGAAFFVENNANIVREMRYDDIQQKYNAENVSILAEDVIFDPVSMAHSPPNLTQEADYIYVVNKDGSFAVFNTMRSQEIAGWTFNRMDGGALTEVAEDGNMIYAVVSRTIDGVDKKYLEVFDPTGPYMDSNIGLVAGSPQATWTGLDHLEGKSVYVIADDFLVEGTFEVSSGSITLPYEASEVYVGLTYESIVDPMPIERELPDGTQIGEIRRIHEVTLNLIKTSGITVNGYPVFYRQFGQDLFNETQSITGVKKVRLLGYSKEPSATIRQSLPLNMELISMVVGVKA